AQYQYTLQADTIADLRAWEPRVRLMMSALPELADVNTDAQDKGLQTSLVIDHDAVARLGLNQAEIDGTLNDLFGQRQVSTIYHPLNQYHVVMEAAPEYWQSPDTLRTVYVTSTAATSTAATGTAATGTDAPGSAGSGTAKAFQDALGNQPLLILSALVAVYLVLGILYESLVHPLTILSTLPSAGVGALLALLATGQDFTIIALIGVILLIGIVKKNAIMMIDFALQIERER